jgi:hypothetical protein
VSIFCDAAAENTVQLSEFGVWCRDAGHEPTATDAAGILWRLHKFQGTTPSNLDVAMLLRGLPHLCPLDIWAALLVVSEADPNVIVKGLRRKRLNEYNIMSDAAGLSLIAGGAGEVRATLREISTLTYGVIAHPTGVSWIWSSLGRLIYMAETAGGHSVSRALRTTWEAVGVSLDSSAICGGMVTPSVKILFSGMGAKTRQAVKDATIRAAFREEHEE